MTSSRRLVCFVVVLMGVGGLVPGLIQTTTSAAVRYKAFLPLVQRSETSILPFGFEMGGETLERPELLKKAQDLSASYARIGGFNWATVQPVQGGAYDWSGLKEFEAELKAVSSARITPIITVRHSPGWATLDLPYPPFKSSCSAVKSERFGDFAAFMAAAVARYSQPPFNVHHWEMGNEVDADPRLVRRDAVFGCWGNIDDPYYGGEHYGRMLQAVTPPMRAVDPNVKVLFGGLLLSTWNTTNPALGKPERFLEGSLRAGAMPYFDYVSFHGHSAYYDTPRDFSGAAGGWAEHGSGPATGKPNFLRSIMNPYGTPKPLILSESTLRCVRGPDCDEDPVFFEAQADHLPRMMLRSMSVGVEGIIWYTLDGPGWGNGGLLDGRDQPRPVYRAYQTLIGAATGAALPPRSVTYVPETEAYRLMKHDHVVDVVWSVDFAPDTISVPLNLFKFAYNRDGVPIRPVVSGGNVIISVGFSPVYVHRLP